MLFLSLGTFILAQLFLGIQAADQCHVIGEADGIYVGSNTSIADYNECLEYCQDSTPCECFTWYSLLGDCVKFVSCSNLDLSCPDCLSGRPTCSKFSECNINGQCFGNFVTLTSASTEMECLQNCQANAECEWYSYLAGDQTCTLLKDCLYVDETCGDCSSGSRTCSLTGMFQMANGLPMMFLLHQEYKNRKIKLPII